MLLTTVFSICPSLNNINLSENQLLGKINPFEYFLVQIHSQLEGVSLNLSKNKISDQVISIIEEYLLFLDTNQLSIVSIDLSHNELTSEGFWLIFHGYVNSPNKNKMKLRLFPIIFNRTFLKTFFSTGRSMNVSLERVSFNEVKRKPPSSRHNLREIKEIEKTIRSISILNKDLAIEKLWELCKRIGGLEHEFPNKKMDELWDVLWDKINLALEYKVNNVFLFFFYDILKKKKKYLIEKG